MWSQVHTYVHTCELQRHHSFATAFGLVQPWGARDFSKPGHLRGRPTSEPPPDTATLTDTATLPGDARMLCQILTGSSMASPGSSSSRCHTQFAIFASAGSSLSALDSFLTLVAAELNSFSSAHQTVRVPASTIRRPESASQCAPLCVITRDSNTSPPMRTAPPNVATDRPPGWSPSRSRASCPPKRDGGDEYGAQ
jgi:hypothetical protein